MDISKYLLTHQLRHSAAVFVYHQLDSDLFGSAHFADLGYPTPILTSHDSHLKVKGKTPPDLLIYNLCYTEKCKKISSHSVEVADWCLTRRFSQTERTKLLKLLPCLRIEQLQKPQLLFPSRR